MPDLLVKLLGIQLPNTSRGQRILELNAQGSVLIHTVFQLNVEEFAGIAQGCPAGVGHKRNGGLHSVGSSCRIAYSQGFNPQVVRVFQGL